jgi:arsenite methyltransferase
VRTELARVFGIAPKNRFLPDAILQAREIRFQFARRLRRQRIDDPVALAIGFDQPAGTKVAKVLRNLHLWLAEDRLKMANTQWSPCQHLQDPQPRTIAQAFINPHEFHSATHASLGIFRKKYIGATGLRRVARDSLRPRAAFSVSTGAMNTNDPETIHEHVRAHYGEIAEASGGGGSAEASSCCGADAQARTLGYSEADLSGIPEGANLGLGCGNPLAIASLQPGQTVLDLGAGAGFDAFLAARAVGPGGRVIGVDMTPAMVTKARANAKKGGYGHVEFRLGEIEALPVADASVDVIISNCVINLCPDKRPVYREAFRVLKAGGRIAVSDVVAREELPEAVKHDLALHCGCLAGATLATDLQRILEDAGFSDIVIRPKSNTDEVITSWETKRGFEAKIFAAEITALKPAEKCCKSDCCT